MMIFASRKIMHESLNLLIDLVLPEGVKKYFEVVKHESDIDNLHLYLDELNIIPAEYKDDKLESKGFYDSVTIQDFPIRGRNVFLHIRRRRWINHSKEKKIISRDWNLVANGTRITKDFADFLKQIG
jgi:transposase